MTVVGPFGLSVRDQALEADVQAGLAAVEEGLLEATKSEVPFITEAAQHLVRAGGKLVRPLLVMLAAQFEGATGVTELLTSLTPFHTEQGCWLVVTSYPEDPVIASLTKPFTGIELTNGSGLSTRLAMPNRPRAVLVP